MITAVPQAPRWDLVAASFLTFAGFASAALGLATDRPMAAALAGLLLLGAVVVRRPTLPWPGLVVFLLLVILFIPIRRYRIPGDLPFQLEPYRLLVGFLVFGWLASLLVDRRVRFQWSRFEVSVGVVLAVTVGSIVANPGRVSEVQSTVLKSFTFLLSFVIVLYLVTNVVRSLSVLDLVVKTLVAGGAVLAVLAVIEARTGLTPFTRLDQIAPFLIPDPSFGGTINRGGATRAYGSAEHPIALGAALVMIVPLAIYVVRSASARWWLAALALVIGVLSSVSRTGVVMLLVVALVFLWLRPTQTKRFWPLLIPLLVATHFVVPGTLGSLKQAFLPEHGLIQDQRKSAGSCSSAGRVADLAPTLSEVSERPFLGHGYGTRIVNGPEANGCILDNQWLGLLVDVGVFGAVAWLLLFLGVIRRLGRAAKDDDSPLEWLMVGITAGITAYAVGMLTFDALSFVQVTLLLFVLLGLAASTLALQAQAGTVARPSVRRLSSKSWAREPGQVP